MHSYTKFDMDEKGRGPTARQFRTFANPCCSLSVRMDVTELVRFCKRTGTSFFLNTLFLTTMGLNRVEEMRWRILDGEYVCYDGIDPGYTVFTDNGTYRNAWFDMTNDYEEFSKRCSETTEFVKKGGELKRRSKDQDEALYYMSCEPWVDFVSVTVPMPLNDLDNMSVPRILWGKYVQEGERYKMTLNLMTCHILVDGYPLSKAFDSVQDAYNHPELYIGDLPDA